ncbi:hypothetical protein Acr_21g0011560 [Actinidia rufa]|uniref:Uncharacterized protein n=1 Tax=Actinidia rufa TaxID=165716 RepID=A0A7J0GIB8_9ERIC|nr:hypothetical protein Acr_21g0011560 [Actinidia rufa]
MENQEKPVVVLTGTAKEGKAGLPLGTVDIGRSENAYLFYVGLPGFRHNARDLKCDIHADGRVHIEGVAGDARIVKDKSGYDMKVKQSGPFTVTFDLLGSVDPRLSNGNNFGNDRTWTHGGVHERNTLPPTGKEKRGKSADIMASLEARLQRVEFAMADNRDKVEDMDQRIDGLKGGNEEFHMEMQGILNSLAESWKVQMYALKDSLQAEIAAIKEEIKEVKGGGDHEGEQKLSSPRHIRYNKDKRNGDKPKLSCFLCDGNHFARDCPQRAKLAALIRDDEEEPHQEEAKVGSLRLLNAIKAKVGKTKAPRKGRMYVEAKAVNTEAWPIYGVARDVRLHIGDWCGQVDFTVVPMDDYPIVLGMEFLDGVRAFPIPFAETMCIMGEGSACMVPLAREALLKSKTLSAIQLSKGPFGWRI